MKMISSKPKSSSNASPEDITELLLACHERIRRFIATAVRIGQATDAPESELRETAGAVRRYFAEALPLHVLDEHDGIEPRLRGRDPRLDEALDRMHAEHAEHAPGLATLVSICGDIELAPHRHRKLRAQLLTLAEDLQDQFERHLEHEERLVIPALRRWLSAEERAQMVVELRARREHASARARTAIDAPRELR
jgi:iron-sulfur cluster repair protein YtfE (RIC family)